MSATKKIPSPFAYFGGKQSMVSRLVPLIPAHHIYVEAFGGAAAVLLGKRPSSVEVYNDLNSGLVNFFRVLRDTKQFKKLQRLCTLTPYSREEYGAMREGWATLTDAVERAHQWFYIARSSFGGLFANSWGFGVKATARGMAACVSRYLSSVEHLPAIAERLLRVQIENRPALALLDTYDSPDTFFYLDPPYVPETRRGGNYECEMTREEHTELVLRLLTLKGKVLLSGYACPAYEPLEAAGWQRLDFPVICKAAGRTRHTGLQGEGSATAKQQRIESVWFNYELPATPLYLPGPPEETAPQHPTGLPQPALA